MVRIEFNGRISFQLLRATEDKRKILSSVLRDNRRLFSIDFLEDYIIQQWIHDYR